MRRGLRAVRARDLVLVGVISAWLVTFTLGMRSVFGSLSEPPCLMAPPHLQIPLPHHGFAWLEGEEQTGPCEAVSGEKWVKKPSGSFDVFVFADGPSGSGRYWTVTVGIGKKRSAKPDRGICLATSTVGWRTLQQYKGPALPWLDDMDGDGKSEVILWDSFPLRDGASMADYGLTAWVYRHSEKDSLTLDWKLSRRMARKIATAYRKPLKTESESLAPLRTMAATALDQFADEACHAPAEAAR